MKLTLKASPAKDETDFASIHVEDDKGTVMVYIYSDGQITMPEPSTFYAKDLKQFHFIYKNFYLFYNNIRMKDEQVNPILSRLQSN